MGGKQSSEITRNEISNEISTTISNYNKTITDIINSQITNSTMNVVNTNAQAISAQTGGGNTINMEDINVSGSGSTLIIDQRVDVKSANQAVANMTQDASAMSNLASQINNDVMNKIQNDAAINQAMQAASKLSKTVDTAGGLNDMIGKVADTIGSVLTPGTKMNSETETIIKNKVMMNISNTNISENKIKALVESNIKNTISQLNTAECKISTVTNNTLTVGNATIDGGGKAIITQVANVNALNTCVIGAAQAANMVIDITSNNETTSTTDTSNKTTATQSMAADSSITDTTITRDAFGDMIKSFSPFAMLGSVGGSICMIVCVIVIALLIFTMMPKGGDGSD